MQDYLREAIAGFLTDNPQSSFQRGYLAALIETAKFAGLAEEEIVKDAEALLPSVVVGTTIQ